MTKCWKCGALILPTDVYLRSGMLCEDGAQREVEGRLPYWHRKCYDLAIKGNVETYGSAHPEEF